MPVLWQLVHSGPLKPTKWKHSPSTSQTVCSALTQAQALVRSLCAIRDRLIFANRILSLSAVIV
jgi:hypothetical protein